MNWYIKVLKNYVGFSGRAGRKEFWFFTLINTVVFIALAFVDSMLGLMDPENAVGLLSGLYNLGVLLPSLAVAFRRLHDTGRTAWWLLIAFIPLIGFIVLIAFMAFDGDEGDNDYGPDPKREPEPAI